MRRNRPPLGGARGFTLTEVMVAALVLAIVAAMGMNALSTVRKRSAYANATNETLSMLRRARNEALGTSVPHVLVLNAVSGHWWLIADVDGNFSLLTFDPSAPAPKNPGPGDDRLLERGRIEEPALVGPAEGWGTAKLPRPYASVPANKACTFCRADGLGAVTFFQDGTASFSGVNPDLGSISFTQTGTGRLRTYAILGRTGAVQVFER